METLAERITRHEGEKLRPYKDTCGYWTIGIGRCLDTKGISHEEAIYLLNNDIASVKQDVNKALPWILGLDDIRRDVLYEMAFQLGLAGLLGFPKMLAAIRGHNYPSAATDMLNSVWHTQTPKRCEELANLMLNGDAS